MSRTGYDDETALDIAAISATRSASGLTVSSPHWQRIGWDRLGSAQLAVCRARRPSKTRADRAHQLAEPAQRHNDFGSPETLAYKITIWEAWDRKHGLRVETPAIAGLHYPTWEELEAE